MLDVEKLLDTELRDELAARGVNVGPVVGTTRLLYEKKLKKLLTSGVKPSSARSNTSRSLNKSITKPLKPPVVKEKTRPESSRRSFLRSAADATMDTTQNSTFNRSEVEEYSDSDEEKVEEEILSPKPKSRQTSFTRRPVSSTPTKQISPKISPVFRATPTSESRLSRVSTTINTSTRMSTTPSVHVPNLITEFTPSFSKFKSVHSGPTSSRNRIGSSVYSPNVDQLGNTSGDEDDLEGIESSRIIYNSKEPSTGLGMTAWKKVLGYGFSASRTPGDCYDLRAGSSRIKVTKNPRTGRVTVRQSNVFSDAIWVAFYAILILLGVLIAAYLVTNHSEKNILEHWSVLKAAGRDSANFFYKYAILPVVFIGALIFICIGLYVGHRKYKQAKEEEEGKLYDLIDKITELVEQSAAEGDSYVSQPHVRDLLFPPSKRRPTEMARWQKAVQFIDSHESRISTDVTILPSGNECAVWKWIGRQKRF